jgi:hypothetical protein
MDDSPSTETETVPVISKHTFYTNEMVIPTSPTADVFPLRTPFLRRQVSSTSLASTSHSSPASAPVRSDRAYPFSFTLPKANSNGEELPPSFISFHTEGVSHPSSVAVEYKVRASWRPLSSLEPLYSYVFYHLIIAASCSLHL